MEQPKKLTPAEREIIKLKILHHAEKNEEYKKLVESRLSDKKEEIKKNPELIEFGIKNKEEAKAIKSLSESEFKDLENMIEKEEIKISAMPYALMRAYFKYKQEKNGSIYK